MLGLLPSMFWRRSSWHRGRSQDHTDWQCHAAVLRCADQGRHGVARTTPACRDVQVGTACEGSAYWTWSSMLLQQPSAMLKEHLEAFAKHNLTVKHTNQGQKCHGQIHLLAVKSRGSAACKGGVSGTEGTAVAVCLPSWDYPYIYMSWLVLRAQYERQMWPCQDRFKLLSSVLQLSGRIRPMRP